MPLEPVGEVSFRITRPTVLPCGVFHCTRSPSFNVVLAILNGYDESPQAGCDSVDEPDRQRIAISHAFVRFDGGEDLNHKGVNREGKQ